jgi:hypothetical protein
MHTGKSRYLCAPVCVIAIEARLQPGVPANRLQRTCTLLGLRAMKIVWVSFVNKKECSAGTVSDQIGEAILSCPEYMHEVCVYQ